MDDFRIIPFEVEEEIENDLLVEDVEIRAIAFVPTLTSKSLSARIKYKQFVISFESLPIDLQETIKKIAIERMSNTLDQQRKQTRK